MSIPRDDARILSAFGQGQACAARAGYLSDNPHPWESVQWQAWREGYALAQRQRVSGR